MPTTIAFAILAASLASSAPADCPADLDGDGIIASSDLTSLLAAWGACPPKSACAADLDGDGEVAAGDLATLLGAWGPCPAGCTGEFAWQSGFGGLPGISPFESTGVYDFEVFDFGTGPVLVAGGDFRLAGGVPARSIAAWNGKAWAPVGEGIDGLVLSLATFDDGAGPALYAGGDFASVGGQPAGNLAKWNGSAWVPIPLGTSSTSGGADTINDMVAFDDGSGPKLWITGEFNQAGGIPALAVATWDGTQWASPGGLLNGYGLALHVHDEGSGPALYLGGTFRPVGLTSSITVARRTATGWIRVGTNIGGSWGGQTATVWDLTSAVAPGTGQPLLVACGGFTLPGLGVAWWNGTTWTSNASSLYGWTRIAVATYPGLSLDDLYLSGPMTFAPTDVYEGIARQSNGAWLPVAGGFGIPSGSPNPPFPMPWTFETFDDGSGPRLFAGGSFLRAGNGVAAGVAAFDGSAWGEVGGGVSNGAGGLNQRSAQVMGTMTIDGEERLVVGGGFTMIDDVTTPFLAGFDGSAWSSVGGGTNNTVYAMIGFDEGAAPGLLVAGAFTRVGVDGIAGLDANRIARWDGRSWSALGSGLDDMARDLEIFDDGNGPRLYACGYFRVAGGIPAFGIARWSGSAWENIGNLESGPGVAGFAYDLAVFDDGSGPALHVAGSFTSAGGVAAGGIARFRDGAWSAVGAPAPLPGGQAILRMHTFDDGTGSRLYAGGTFTQIGGVNASRLARWDGSGWTAVPGLANGDVRSMATFDDGSGPRLAVGGSFTLAGGSPADRIALLDRSGWSSLGGGTNGAAFCLFATGGADGPTLVAGGAFWSAGGVISRGLGWWRCTRP